MVYRICIVFLVLALIQLPNVSAQVKIADKKRVDKAISPQTSQIIYNGFIANLIQTDMNGGENFQKKTIGFEIGATETSAILNSTLIGSFFVSRKDLIDFLYDSGRTNPNLIGINIWFTNNNNQIAITKTISSSDTTIEDLNSDYKLLISKPLINNTALKSNFISPTLSLSKIKNVNIPIQGYFIGRISLLRKILNSDDSINTSYAGFEFIVRERNNQKFICFYAVKNIKNKVFYGLAKYSETEDINPSAIFALDKMGGSRPCPPYCRKD